MAESIERRADAAFSHKRTEREYNVRFGKFVDSVMLGTVTICTCRMDELTRSAIASTTALAY